MNVMSRCQPLLILLALCAACAAKRQYQADSSALNIAITIGLTAALLLLAEMTPYARLALSGRETVANVVHADCVAGQKKHILYKFSAGNHTVTDIAPAGYGNPPCENLVAGSIGKAYYLPEDPSVHVWGDPKLYVGERIVAIVFIQLFATLFSYSGIRKMRTYQR